MPRDLTDTNWPEVAAKAQAYTALHLAGLGDGTVAEKARFLQMLGMSRADIAALIDSTEESVRKSLERATKRGTRRETRDGG